MSSGLTDAGGDGRAALLVTLGAAVAGDTRYAVLARALTGGLVTGLSRGPDWMAVARWNETENISCQSGNVERKQT